MTHEDAYAGIAERYDLFRGRFGEHGREEMAFFWRLFEKHGVRRVLDCACGTGHDLHLFYLLGCQVMGADISPAMLAQARANLAALRLDLPLVQADYRHLPLHDALDAVACLSSSFLHMPDEAEALRALGSMRGVLRSGGLLIMTQGTTDRQWAERPRFIPAINTPDVSRLFVIDYHPPGATYHILDLYHAPERAEFHVWSQRYERVWLRDDYRRLLGEAGFGEVSFYGDWAGAPYDQAKSQRLITVARA